MQSLQLVGHCISSARFVLSPNCDERPDNKNINLLTVHNISLPPGQFGGSFIEDLFTNQLNPLDHPYFESIYQLKVSAHLLVLRDGRLIQFVPFNKRAWHAGVSSFRTQSRCNDFSIGIELEGSDLIDYTEQQYQQLVNVTALLMASYPKLNADRICGHEHIAPGRKTDPGPAFDWHYFFHNLKEAVT